MIVGLISDNHGQIPPNIKLIFQQAGVQEIWHAGDAGHIDTLRDLASVATLRVVAGNVDAGTEIARQYPLCTTFKVEKETVVMIHILEDLLPEALDEATMVIYGHTHIADCREIGMILHINPGSCRKPFNGPPTVMVLTFGEDKRKIELVNVEDMKLVNSWEFPV